jgi:hypothetical protein
VSHFLRPRPKTCLYVSQRRRNTVLLTVNYRQLGILNYANELVDGKIKKEQNAYRVRV